MNDEEFPLKPRDEHNEALVAAVRPRDWVNPTPAPLYDLVVIGAGTAGLVTAAGAAGLGAKVALIERHLMGGDCLNYGCVPSKALIRAARACAAVRAAGDFGVSVPAGVRVDFPKVMERLRRLRAEISSADSAARFKDLGVDVFIGDARFSRPDSVTVGESRLSFKKAVIATGARAAAPDVPGLAEAGYLTNETVFGLTTLPPRLTVIGGGPIGCELAQAFARFGSKVTILQSARQILDREDADAAELAAESMRRDGVEIVIGAKVLRVTAAGAAKRVVCEAGGRSLEVDGEAILVAAGRAPNVAGMNLEGAGVEFDARAGVKVDDHLRTTNRRVFAAGDVCLGAKFTHAADFSARIVIQNALFFGRKCFSDLVIPWCTYTDPEVAHIGLYEKDAIARGLKVKTFVQSLAEVDRAVLDGEHSGFVRMLVEEGGSRILGVTIVASHAGEMIGEISLAMSTGTGLDRIASVIHPYPTQAEAIRKLGDAYNRTRLTPTARSFLRMLMRWSA
jgi:pyruvate/2-oxoglutarate dehydrogenase complex dihydrolipoamide dehydrogenase (E3) component